jgi:hypothetical protein
VFLKPDPVAVFEAETLLEQPIRLSAYTYGSGDSITRMDPSGKVFETLWDVASFAMGVVSLKENISTGSYWSAAVDAVGIVADGAAIAVPFVPGGVSAVIKAGRVGAKAADKVVDLARVADKAGDAKKVAGAKPPNLSPPGAGRHGAFREAKRQNGIPVSQQPSRVSPNLDKRGNPQPGRTYEFDKGPGKDPTRIRDDAAGHDYGPVDPQNRGPHFNDPAGNHYDY